MQALVLLLQQESELVSRLHQLLREEHTALRTGLIESVEEIARQKSCLIEEINRLDGLRVATIGHANAGPAGMDAWLLAHPDQDSIAQLWRRLIEITRESRSVHEQNGALINALLARTNHALGLIQQADALPGLYSSDGQTASGASGRIVDSA